MKINPSQFKPDFTSIMNYFPYGKQLTNATWTTTDTWHKNDLNYGFNGMWKDQNIRGAGGSLDFGARIFNSDLGIFLSRDPFEHLFVSQSAYVFAGNDPVNKIDVDGEAEFKVNLAFQASIHNFSGDYSFGIGGWLKLSNIQIGLSFNQNQYDDGPGTPNNAKESQVENILSISSALGSGMGFKHELNVFDSRTANTIQNDYMRSINLGKTWIFNSNREEGMQSVWSWGFTFGKFDIYDYNDMAELFWFGSGTDQYNTNGLVITQVFSNGNSLQFSGITFTGILDRRDNDEKEENEMYYQPEYEKNYNNEMLSLTYGNNNGKIGLFSSGNPFQLQNLWHDFIGKPRFDYNSTPFIWGVTGSSNSSNIIIGNSSTNFNDTPLAPDPKRSN